MAFINAPSPSPVRTRPYKYSVIKEFLDVERLILEGKVKKGDGRYAICTDDDYLQPDLKPFPGQDGHKAALDALIEKNGGKSYCRLVYITRHAESDHNVKAIELGKVESFAAADHFDVEQDPSLSAQGVVQALQLSDRIMDSKAAAFGVPGLMHCSPLWRCVQTAAYSGSNYHLSFSAKINDKWCEWTGPGQLHVSDARSTKTVLHSRIDSLNAQLGGAEMTVRFADGFTENDEDFFNPETFINVDICLEQALDEVFQPGPLCRHIITHGRALHSLMRVLGFRRRDNRPKEFRVWDFENAGTIVVLIKREPRVDHLKQLERDKRLQQEELRYINSKYSLEINDGFRKNPGKRLEEPYLAGRLGEETPWAQ